MVDCFQYVADLDSNRRSSFRVSTYADIKRAENRVLPSNPRHSNSFIAVMDLSPMMRVNVEVRNSFLHRINIAAMRSEIIRKPRHRLRCRQ